MLLAIGSLALIGISLGGLLGIAARYLSRPIRWKPN